MMKPFDPRKYLDNKVDWEIPLKEILLMDCHKCNDFVVTNDKAEITLFMLDHYGADYLRKCKAPDTEY